MSDPDRLPMIEANMADSRRTLRPPYVTSDDADWLVAEVKERGREAERGRGLLRRLEWAGRLHSCPICHRFQDPGEAHGHVPGCDLAAVLHAGSGSGASDEDAKREPAPQVARLQAEVEGLRGATAEQARQLSLAYGDPALIADGLTSEVERLRHLADERGREVARLREENERLRALLEPSVTMTSPHVTDPGNDQAPPTREG